MHRPQSDLHIDTFLCVCTKDPQPKHSGRVGCAHTRTRACTGHLPCGADPGPEHSPQRSRRALSQPAPKARSPPATWALPRPRGPAGLAGRFAVCPRPPEPGGTYRSAPQGSGSSAGSLPSWPRASCWARPGRHTAPPTPSPSGSCSSGGPPCRPGTESKRQQVHLRGVGPGAAPGGAHAPPAWTGRGGLAPLRGRGGARSRRWGACVSRRRAGSPRQILAGAADLTATSAQKSFSLRQAGFSEPTRGMQFALIRTVLRGRQC